MWVDIDTQLIFIYNGDGQITKTIFLSLYEDVYEKSKTFQMFKFLTTKLDFLSTDYDVVKDHLLLTLTIDELRGYIQKSILKNDEDLLLFSLWFNLDYSVENDTFFPFNLSKPYKKNPGSSIVYEIAPNIFTNQIFCILPASQTINKGMCSNGIYNPYVLSFINDLKTIETGDEDPICVELENRSNFTYHIRWSDNLLAEIRNLKNINLEMSLYKDNEFYLSGEHLYFLEPCGFSKPCNQVRIYEGNFNNKIITIENDVLTVHNTTAFDNILAYSNLRNGLVKQKNIKKYVNVVFSAEFSSNILIDFENDFLINTTYKTKNIFIDRSKKHNIITSSKHIIFSSFILNDGLYLYLTKMIIALQIINKMIFPSKRIKKLGNRYFSRYCQGNRRPQVYKKLEIDPAEYTIFNDFYKNIRNEGDIFFSKEWNSYHVCEDPTLPNIGFISEVFDGYGTCLPCCFKKPKDNSSIFQTCSGMEITNNNSLINPFIHIFENYRIITDKTRLGLLLNGVDKLFNSGARLYSQTRSVIKEIDTIKRYEGGSNRKIPESILGHNNLFISDRSINTYKHIEQFEDYSSHNVRKNTSILCRSTIVSDEEFINKKTKFGVQYNDLLQLDNCVLINKQSRIELAKNYIIYRIHDEGSIDFHGIDSILDTDDKHIFIINDKFCFNPVLVDYYNEDKETFLKEVEFFIVIQNKIHIIQCINKTEINDTIVLSPVPINIKKRILDDKFDINPLKYSITYKNINFDEFSYRIDKKKTPFYKQQCTKYLFKIEKVLLSNKSLGHFITDTLYKKYFEIIPEELVVESKIVFLANLVNILPFEISTNNRYDPDTDKELINSIKKYLNPKWM